MIKSRFVFSIILILISYQGVEAFTVDSLRLETIDGQEYIIHQVDPGETLYSISKRYQCSMNTIAESTPDVRTGLHDGMIIKIPYSAENIPKPSGNAIHVVKQGETLYSISQIYNVSVIDIMEWNDLMSADLEIEQKLTIKGRSAEKAPVDYVLDGMRIHVVQAGEGLYAIARQYGVDVDQLVEWNELTSSSLNLGQEIIVGKLGTDNQNDVMQTVVTDSTAVSDLDSVAEYPESSYANTAPVPMVQKKEDGLASVIEGGTADNTFLAMHRTIPVGSLVSVRNEMGNQVVFVRIIGVLPDTGVNNKIIIRLSTAAVEQLRAIDPKFRVEITYLVPEE